MGNNLQPKPLGLAYQLHRATHKVCRQQREMTKTQQNIKTFWSSCQSFDTSSLTANVKDLYIQFNIELWPTAQRLTPRKFCMHQPINAIWFIKCILNSLPWLFDHINLNDSAPNKTALESYQRWLNMVFLWVQDVPAKGCNCTCIHSQGFHYGPFGSAWMCTKMMLGFF